VDHLHDEVAKLHSKYLELAAAHHG
jgi:hypothetical protein